MSHEIYKEKFVTLRHPAWHDLGQVLNVPLPAVQAGGLVKLPTLRVEPVVGRDTGIITTYKALVGVEGDKQTVYSVVTNLYHEISHQTFLETWDRATNAYVETLGLLYKGSTLFVTTRLPSFSVKGDEVEPYLLAVNPLVAGKVVVVRKTPVRVVCNNTLEASGKNFLTEWRVVHYKNAVAQLESFLRNAVAQAAAEYETVKEVFELLASKKLQDEQSKELFAGVYPDLPRPEAQLAKLVDPSEEKNALEVLAAWERENGAQVSHRETCYNLYQGRGLGSLTTAAAGTAWGAYNAVVEYEQYLKRYAQTSSFLFGAGAKRVERAYELALDASR